MHNSMKALITSAMIAIPTGATVSTASPFSPISVAAAHAAAAATTTRTIKGPSVTMNWGQVQVTIIVKGKKIIDVRATAPAERPRSAYINRQAIPWLRSEVLQAQSANIDLISGATMTSEAYAQSLQAAIKTAKI